MDDLKKSRPYHSRGESDAPYSRAIKAGKRVYYFDAKLNQNNELYLTITESKKSISADENRTVSFEKHKIFLFEEDFTKFAEGFNDVMNYIVDQNAATLGDYDAAEE